jgi:hypothetical protein
MTPDKIAGAAIALLTDQELRMRMQADLAAVKQSLTSAKDAAARPESGEGTSSSSRGALETAGVLRGFPDPPADPFEHAARLIMEGLMMPQEKIGVDDAR